MARYTGPSTKIARKFGEPVFGPDKSYEKKNYPPGQHGLTKKRKKTSEYGTQLKEKQKVKYTYGVLEKQFSNLFDRASRTKGITGEVLLQLLESRLDNVVFRMNLARTRRAARQLVNHGHILVDGRKVDIPSFIVKPGSVITVKESSRNMPSIKEALEATVSTKNYVTFDKEAMKGIYVRLPERAELNDVINEALVVEYYNR